MRSDFTLVSIFKSLNNHEIRLGVPSCAKATNKRFRLDYLFKNAKYSITLYRFIKFFHSLMHGISTHLTVCHVPTNWLPTIRLSISLYVQHRTRTSENKSKYNLNSNYRNDSAVNWMACRQRWQTTNCFWPIYKLYWCSHMLFVFAPADFCNFLALTMHTFRSVWYISRVYTESQRSHERVCVALKCAHCSWFTSYNGSYMLTSTIQPGINNINK